jgi:hypothetical protein
MNVRTIKMRLPLAVKQSIEILKSNGYEAEVSMGKHIRIKAPGLPPLYYGKTTSDWRAAENFLSLTRKTIREAVSP